MEFVRYGNLSKQQHDRPDDEKDFYLHTPPTEYGFYAFPKGYEESFLIGGIGSGNVRNGRFHFLRDSNGNKIKTTHKELFSEKYHPKKYYYYLREPFKTMMKKQKINDDEVVLYVENTDKVYDDSWHPFIPGYIAIRNPRTTFKYTGNIWHHLEMYCSKHLVKPADVIKRSGEWILTDMKTYEKALKKYVSLCKSSLMFNKYSNCNNVQGTSEGLPLTFSKDEFEVYIEDIQKENKRNK